MLLQLNQQRRRAGFWQRSVEITVQALVGCGESWGLPMPDGKSGDGTGCELWTHPAGLDTDPVLELEFDQTANLAPEGSVT